MNKSQILVVFYLGRLNIHKTLTVRKIQIIFNRLENNTLTFGLVQYNYIKHTNFSQ